MQRARADDATTVVTIFVNPRQFDEPADFERYPRNEARDLGLRRRGRRPGLGAAGRGGLPAGFDTLVRVGAVAVRSRARLARALRWRRHRRRHPVRARRRRARLLRPEGRPAGHGHPPDGARPGAAARTSSPAPRCASRRPRALVAQRPPLARRNAPRRRSSTARCWPPAIAGRAGERSAEALRERMRRRARDRAAGRRRVRLVRGWGHACASSTSSRARRCSRGGPLRGDASHRQRAARRLSGPPRLAREIAASTAEPPPRGRDYEIDEIAASSATSSARPSSASTWKAPPWSVASDHEATSTCSRSPIGRRRRPNGDRWSIA